MFASVGGRLSARCITCPLPSPPHPQTAIKTLCYAQYVQPGTPVTAAAHAWRTPAASCSCMCCPCRRLLPYLAGREQAHAVCRQQQRQKHPSALLKARHVTCRWHACTLSRDATLCLTLPALSLLLRPHCQPEQRPGTLRSGCGVACAVRAELQRRCIQSRTYLVCVLFERCLMHTGVAVLSRCNRATPMV